MAIPGIAPLLQHLIDGPTEPEPHAEVADATFKWLVENPMEKRTSPEESVGTQEDARATAINLRPSKAAPAFP